jgi:hypothetical protein
MCYDVNPLSMKLHLCDLDRQAGLSRRPRSNMLVAPRKVGRALVALLRRVRGHFGSKPHEPKAACEPSVATS